MKVRTGLDVLIAEKARRLAGCKVAILANQSAVDSRLVHLLDALAGFSDVEVVKLFAPEHGFRGELQDMASVDSAVDRVTGIPVISLYGKTESSLAPKAEDLAGVDVLLVDLPDIGTRYYTFAQSLGYSLAIAAKTGTRVMVLDRPNPLDGVTVEGPGLEKSCRSFCGYLPVPPRHGLTLGELALMMNKGYGQGESAIPALGAKLEVVSVTGWSRKQAFDETGLPWVIPSPNMPTLDTTYVYPGACLVEATEISEGRGTTRPFEFIGAPGIEPEKWIAAVLAQGVTLKGARLRAHSFQPQFQKHAGKLCFGVQIHVTNRPEFQSFRWTLALLFALKKTHPDVFEWRSKAYEFVTDVPAIDLLYGSSKLREAVDGNGRVADLLPEIESFEREFLEARKPFLLY